ncbi:MAG: TIGR02587 family membrane protein [Elainellaceae cyanobacterium]
MNRRRRRRAAWRLEVEELVRGTAGGFLFGVPLLYTIEVWWVGSAASPPLMVFTLMVTAIVVFLLNRTAGFRRTRSVEFWDAAIDTVEAIAIGLISAALLLLLLRKVTLATQLHETLGKVIFESVPFSLGVTLANQFLSGDPDGGMGEEPADNLNETLTDIGVTLIGALIIAFSIAPTEEISTLAAAVSGGWLLGIIAVSLVVSYGIVFAASFPNQYKRQQQRGLFQDPLSETILSYLVSLAAAALMLGFFQQLSLDDPWSMWLHYTLLLGLPASVGGAAGRLAI